MTKFVAIPTEDIPKHRLVALTRTGAEDDNKVYIRLAQAGEMAEFASSYSDITESKEVVVTIGESHVWTAEAGEDIVAGVPIVSGNDGVVISNYSADGSVHPRTLGYSVHSAKAGEKITFVKDYRVAKDTVAGGGDSSEEITALQTKVNELTESVATVQSDVTGVSGDVSTLTSKVSAVETSSSDNASAISTVQSSVSGNTSTINTLDGKVSTNETTISDLVARVEALENAEAPVE